MQYQEYPTDEITKELLDTIKVGDTIRCNDWKRGMKVVGVSENYFLMASYPFGKTLYSICEKTSHMGKFYIGPDNLIFGYLLGYDFRDLEVLKNYLEDLENKEIEVSPKRSTALTKILIKKGELL